MKKLLLVLALACLPVCAQQRQCPNTANIVVTASGTTNIVSAFGGQRIHVCKVTFASSTGVDVKFQSVGASTIDISGVYKGISTLAFDFNGDLKTVAGNDKFAINLATAATLGGVMTYYQDLN